MELAKQDLFSKRMAEDTKKVEGVENDVPVVEMGAEVAPVVSAEGAAESSEPRGHGRFNDRGRGRGGRRREVRERVKPEFDQKMIAIRRVARVVAGGRRFSFSVALVAGNRKGSVGVGLGKGADTQLAIDKAMRSAKRHMVKLPLTKNNSIAHDVAAKYSSGKVFIQPSRGRGLIAGGPVRIVLELAGINDVVAKVQSGSKNSLNIARATVKALSDLRSATK